MPPRRYQEDWETAAPAEEGSGCFSAYLFPPLVVLLVGWLMASFLWNAPRARAAAPPFPTGGIAPLFRAEVQFWAESLVRWGNAAGVDPNLAATVMQIESCGDPQAKSGAGAIGLFQVMPYHFQRGENPYDPEINARRGLAYLARSLQAAGGDVRLALAGYNGGIATVSRAEIFWAAETRRYVQYGVPIYEDARAGKSSSAALDAWHQRYGASLCSNAARRLGLKH